MSSPAVLGRLTLGLLVVEKLELEMAVEQVELADWAELAKLAPATRAPH